MNQNNVWPIVLSIKQYEYQDGLNIENKINIGKMYVKTIKMQPYFDFFYVVNVC